MSQAEPLVEIWRGQMLESVHTGQIVICGPDGEMIEAWGDPNAIIFPRSACKMIQALPLATSGETLSSEQLALSCASHQGAARPRMLVTEWLADLGLGEAALRCGPQEPRDVDERNALIRAREEPCQIHNNCSGKHTGFLTLTKRLRAGQEYIDIDHPVQRAVRASFEEVTGETSPTWGIDGCSAPNFAVSLKGLARAMAAFATAHGHGGQMAEAMVRLRSSMMRHPDLVAGEGRACTELMEAAPGVAVKTGAEGVFTAILPEEGIGIALKISDGTTRAAEAAMAQLLIRAGKLEAAHPAAQKYLGPIRNRRNVQTGVTRPAARLSAL